MAKLYEGDLFPNIILSPYNSEEKNVSDFPGKYKLIWASRYIGCSLCRLDIHLLNENCDKFREKDCEVIVITQSDSKHIKDNLELTQETINYDLICDPEMKVYKLLDIKPAQDKSHMVADKEKFAFSVWT